MLITIFIFIFIIILVLGIVSTFVNNAKNRVKSAADHKEAEVSTERYMQLIENYEKGGSSLVSESDYLNASYVMGNPVKISTGISNGDPDRSNMHYAPDHSTDHSAPGYSTDHSADHYDPDRPTVHYDPRKAASFAVTCEARGIDGNDSEEMLRIMDESGIYGSSDSAGFDVIDFYNIGKRINAAVEAHRQ